MQRYTIENLKNPIRIDLYIVGRDPKLTRSTAKRIIMEGAVQLNNEKVRPNQHVKEGDIIIVNEKLVQKLIHSSNLTQLKPVKMKIDIVYEDNHLIVVNKSPGIVVHPVYQHKEDTLMNGLVYYMIEKKHDMNLERLRPVHRLDKDTSGIIIFTKSKDGHEYYSDLFSTHTLEKTYYAVVKGDFKKYIVEKRGELSKGFEVFTYIGRDRNDSKLFANTNEKDGLAARTRIYFEDYWKGNKKYSLVRVVPETGRTHQIRVHLSNLGFPILGDPLYSDLPYKRLMLHAYSLRLKLMGSDKDFVLTAKASEDFGINK